MAELLSNKWLIVLNNIECSHLSFKLQLYKTDVTPESDSIDQTDGTYFTTKGDIDIDRTIVIHDISNPDFTFIIDTPNYNNIDDLHMNTINDKNIYINYIYEEPTTIGSLKCAIKLCDLMTYPNNIQISNSVDGINWISYQSIDISYVQTYVNENNDSNKEYIVFEVIRSIPENDWILSKCKMF